MSVSIYIPEDRMKVMVGIQRATSTHNCPQCQQPAYCAMEDGKSPNLCWCMTVPTKGRDSTPLTSADSCLCRDCLTGQKL